MLWNYRYFGCFIFDGHCQKENTITLHGFVHFDHLTEWKIAIPTTAIKYAIASILPWECNVWSLPFRKLLHSCCELVGTLFFQLITHILCQFIDLYMNGLSIHCENATVGNPPQKERIIWPGCVCCWFNTHRI